MYVYIVYRRFVVYLKNVVVAYRFDWGIMDKQFVRKLDITVLKLYKTF